MGLSNAERQARWRQNHPANDSIRAAGRMRAKRFYTKHGNPGVRIHPFIGVDGEGGGKDEFGRQHYLLMRAARKDFSSELFRGNQPLTTVQCLEWILSLPANSILVGYFFTYDATQILRDLPPERIARLFQPRNAGEGKSPYTFWKDYAIDFMPRQYFRVGRVVADGQRMRTIPGSSRTINEVGGFFQKSFVESLISWNIGDPAVIDKIAAGKERRSEFVEMTDTEREYCHTECVMLAELMEEFRRTCDAVDIKPSSWRGAGAIAASLHAKHETPRRADFQRSSRLENSSIAAYYGGRFEIQFVGRIPGPVYEYDINSAYPASMLKLPCSIHGRWRPFKEEPPDGTIYVARIIFGHVDGAYLCGFPVRQKGRLFWPRRADGYYWSPEIEAARRAGAIVVEWRGGYYYEQNCQCKPFTWVEELYAARKSLGKQTKGYPIKLGINGLYGKLAQRMGGAPWRDLVSAGLITANTRAMLIDAYASNPAAVIMLATDGVFSTQPLPVTIGDQLGTWEMKERPTGLFVVQPGVYWSPGSDTLPKTRGIPRSRIIEKRATFERLFDRWVRGDGRDDAPSLSIDITQFIGHRLALSRNRPLTAGQWRVNSKEISFDWGNKRALSGVAANGFVTTMPYSGSFGLRSEAYDPAALTELSETNLEGEAADDWEPWGNTDE